MNTAQIYKYIKIIYIKKYVSKFIHNFKHYMIRKKNSNEYTNIMSKFNLLDRKKFLQFRHSMKHITLQVVLHPFSDEI